MRKIASILLITVLLFNWFGYRLLTGYRQQQATLAMTQQLDRHDYSESQLISIKIPANLPYYNNSMDFERVDGQVEIAGIHYNYVKRRVYKDSLEYLCIPNFEKTRIASAGNEFYKLVNDLKQPAQNKKGGDTNLLKSPMTDLYQVAHSWAFETFELNRKQEIAFVSQVLPSISVSPHEVPPDAFVLL